MVMLSLAKSYLSVLAQVSQSRTSQQANEKPLSELFSKRRASSLTEATVSVHRQGAHKVFSGMFVWSCCASFLAGRSLSVAVKGFLAVPLYCPPALLCYRDEWSARGSKYLLKHRQASDLREIGNDEQQFYEQIIEKMQIGTAQWQSTADGPPSS
jgi:hypothetical protein